MKERKEVRTLVVKAGTRVLLQGTEALDRRNIERLLNELIDARESGIDTLLVSSGAIGAGLKPLGFSRRPGTIPDLQACAAVGQILLMQAYNEILQGRGYVVAQLLLTHEDFRDRERYLNLRNTLGALRGHKVLPVVNENDPVAVDEIRFGDNDVLCALVSNAVDADLTILLSDVDGLYTEHPRTGANPQRIPVVERVTPEIEALAFDSDSGLGSGGMSSKIRAAKMVTRFGGTLVLADGKRASVAAILRGEVDGTKFLPHGSRLAHRKRWIAWSLKESGVLHVDAGAARAVLERGKSLLPAGVIGCDGEFGEGAAVAVRLEGRTIAKGLVNYPAEVVRRIIGRRSSELKLLVGEKYFEEVIHRDNLVAL